MVFDRPNRPNSPQRPATNRPNPATQSAATNPPRKVITTGGGGRGGGNGDSRGNSEPQPSPWLEHPLHPNGQVPNTNRSASFVEYLRWMRIKSDNKQVDSGTVLDLFSRFEQNDFSELLERRIKTTKVLANEWFEAKCNWRIRVGGTRGPESMLLPAFDALGMPYVPGSTLRGIARVQAIRQFMKDENLNWEDAEQKISAYFGSLQADGNNHTSKVIFLDAYPLPGSNKQGGLKPDMANAIWRWEGNEIPKYNTNPNSFLSLEKSKFVIGLRQASTCDELTFKQVKKWLINGLAQGIGSRVNSGYGGLDFCKREELQKDLDIKLIRKKSILIVDFELKGQLIHGRQKFSGWQRNNQGTGWKPPGISEPEPRAIAFRSMLRYWFRAFALGILPSNQVRELEMEIFGGIDGEIKPKYTGLFRMELIGEVHRDNARPNRQGQNEPCGLIIGKLTLRNSSQTASLSDEKKIALEMLLKDLTWLMFRLGGIGQGARRPCHSRQNRENGRAPWWRGSTLASISSDDFWKLPDRVTDFQQKFRQRLQSFYDALVILGDLKDKQLILSNKGRVTSEGWVEAVDQNCLIVVCSGESSFDKPYALSVLHSHELKDRSNYDGRLCGKVDRRDVIPSPVWIADLGDYQVVTVFGVMQDPRKKYVQALRDNAQGFADIFPLQ